MSNSHKLTLTDQIPPILKQWCEQITQNKPEAMLEFYAKNAVLLGTLDPNLEITHSGILKYFKMFFGKNEFKSVKIDNNITQCGMENLVICSGQYTFVAVKQEVTARYSFVFRRCIETGKWKIINHHSSLPADEE